MSNFNGRWEVLSSDAPAAIGPYSQGVVISAVPPTPQFLFASGQIPLDPATGAIVEGGIEAQTKRVMDNLTAVLAESHLTWENVAKTTIYLTDLEDFETVNKIYASYLGKNKPARTTIAVVGLPRGAKIEIELIAANS